VNFSFHERYIHISLSPQPPQIIIAPPARAAIPARTACCVILGTPPVLELVLVEPVLVGWLDWSLPLGLDPGFRFSSPAVTVTGMTRSLRSEMVSAVSVDVTGASVPLGRFTM